VQSYGAHATADAPAATLEVFMFDESKLLSADFQLELQSWTAAWCDQVVKAGFIRPPFQPDDATVSRLHGYFKVGLSPTEAAQALFGPKH
jgi:hypothetical protein